MLQAPENPFGLLLKCCLMGVLPSGLDQNTRSSLLCPFSIALTTMEDNWGGLPIQPTSRGHLFRQGHSPVETPPAGSQRSRFAYRTQSSDSFKPFVPLSHTTQPLSLPGSPGSAVLESQAGVFQLGIMAMAFLSTKEKADFLAMGLPG